MGRKYICEHCKQENESNDDWTEEKEEAEKAKNGWKDTPREECVLVCDDCYKIIMQQLKN